MNIRTETNQDMERVQHLLLQAFPGQAEARLVEELRKDPQFVPELSIVAEENGIIKGHILLSQGQLLDGHQTHAVAALAPLAVLPKYQRQGIGGLLVEEGKRRCASLGYPLVFLFGHPTYYPRFGFEQARRYGLDIKQFTVSDEVFMVAELKSGALEKLQGEFRYPPAFENLE
ncbi:N-acetyltransferase [Paenibacillus sp. JCM 10914]|uniref:GNAT family N-acetyltransferase n=1 Tax=Paenibacillus sp. JCM 10914 TaxID=1236974 RepID=UPI0003CC3D9D|nr:N-acetyltransferase [Paenibacillus sp. JCM 10914]GAE05247.1 acetyltransferase [Paenibacillus sp. JCM 10914]